MRMSHLGRAGFRSNWPRLPAWRPWAGKRLFIGLAAKHDDGLDAFPRHALRPLQHGFGIHQLSAIPMLLQDAPAPFDRVVLAVVGWEVKQLVRPAGGVGKVDHALEELGAPAATFRAVVGLDLDVRNDGPLPLGQHFVMV